LASGKKDAKGELFLFHRHQDNNMQGEKFTSVKAVGIAQDRNARFRRTMEVRPQQPNPGAINKALQL